MLPRKQISTLYVRIDSPHTPSTDKLFYHGCFQLKNGRDIIHSMEQLKPKISDIFEQWAVRNPELVNSPTQLQQRYGGTISPVVKSRAAKRQDSIHDHYTNSRSAMSSAGGVVPVAGPSAGPSAHLQRSNSIGPGYSSAAITADDLARRVQQLTLGARSSSAASQQPLSGPSADADLSRRVAEAVAKKKWQQDVAEEVKKKEQERVMYEQQKNDNRRRAQESAIAAAKQAAAMSIGPTAYPARSSSIQSQHRQAQAQPSFPQAEQPFGGGALPHLPLQSPLLFHERESPRNSINVNVGPWVRNAFTQTAFVGGAPIEYPRLMSPHQQQQGYFPNPQPLIPIISTRPLPQPLPQPQIQVAGNSLYNIPLPQRASPAPPYNPSQLTTPTYGRPGPSYPHQQPPMSGPSRSAPPPPPPQQSSTPRVLPAPPTVSTPTQAQIVARPASPTHDANGLRLIDVPSEVLNRFLAVAQVNTLRKKETCGLLLGREKGPGRGFILCTLLIPEQRSTSDTCTMENEELVVEFQIGRELVTLGWVSSPGSFRRITDAHDRFALSYLIDTYTSHTILWVWCRGSSRYQGPHHLFLQVSCLPSISTRIPDTKTCSRKLSRSFALRRHNHST
jgi:STAM-binding protein